MRRLFIAILLACSLQAFASTPSSLRTLSVLRECVDERRQNACKKIHSQESYDNEYLEFVWRGAEDAYGDVMDLIDASIKYVVNSEKGGEKK